MQERKMCSWQLNIMISILECPDQWQDSISVMSPTGFYSAVWSSEYVASVAAILVDLLLPPKDQKTGKDTKRCGPYFSAPLLQNRSTSVPSQCKALCCIHNTSEHPFDRCFDSDLIWTWIVFWRKQNGWYRIWNCSYQSSKSVMAVLLLLFKPESTPCKATFKQQQRHCFFVTNKNIKCTEPLKFRGRTKRALQRCAWWGFWVSLWMGIWVFETVNTVFPVSLCASAALQVMTLSLAQNMS